MKNGRILLVCKKNFVYLRVVFFKKSRFIYLNVINLILIMKQKYKYPLIYRLDAERFIVWLSATKCYVVQQLKLFV